MKEYILFPKNKKYTRKRKNIGIIQIYFKKIYKYCTISSLQQY